MNSRPSDTSNKVVAVIKPRNSSSTLRIAGQMILQGNNSMTTGNTNTVILKIEKGFKFEIDMVAPTPVNNEDSTCIMSFAEFRKNNAEQKRQGKQSLPTATTPITPITIENKKPIKTTTKQNKYAASHICEGKLNHFCWSKRHINISQPSQHPSQKKNEIEIAGNCTNNPRKRFYKNRC